MKRYFLIAGLLCLTTLTGCGRNPAVTPEPVTEAVTTAAMTEVTAESETVPTMPETETTMPETETEAPGALEGIRIGLDPGHQLHANSEQEPVAPGSSQTKAKVSGGAVGTATGIPEYVTVLEIAELLKADLEAEGAVVCMSRETHDVDISNRERAEIMNEFGADLMLRIHCDGSADSGARGIGLFVSQSNAIAEQSRQYAETMLPVICETLGANNRGLTQNDTYTGQNWAEVPCIMIECGFLSNPEEDRLLNDPDYQAKLAEAVTQGIIACFAEASPKQTVFLESGE